MSGRGRFLTVEGVEGAGKTTQVAALIEWLTARGLVVRSVREPGGTPLSEKIRELLLSTTAGPTTPLAELLLFQAARAELTASRIIPALKAGEWVVADRFYDSTVAYQGFGRGLELELIELLNRVATTNLRPDLTIYLDLDPDRGLLRAGGKAGGHDRLELEAREFHHRVYDGFRQMAASEERIRLIPVNDLAPDEVAREVRKVVSACFFPETGL